MKKIIPLFFTLSMLAFGCTEEVIKIIKEKDTDTLWLPGPVQFVQTSKTEECESLDTAKVEIIMPDVVINGQQYKDTTVAITTACHMKITIKGRIAIPTKIVHDSIPYPVYVDRPVPGPIQYVMKDTTIYETKVVYSTHVEYIFPGNSVYWVPEPLRPYFEEFNREALAHGRALIGGDIVVSFVDPDNLPGEFWSSNTFEMAGGQQVLELSSELVVEHSKSPIFRELGRWQLKKKYTNLPDKIMNPTLPPENAVTTQQINDLFL